MKSDLVRLIETFELKYERLQAENIRLKRKINRLLKKEREVSIRRRNSKLSSISPTIDLPQKICSKPRTLQSLDQNFIPVHEQIYKQTPKQPSPKRYSKSRRFRSFNKKLYIKTNVRV